MLINASVWTKRLPPACCLLHLQVALHELPPGVTPHLATSVEFVGRAVRLLRAPPASAKLKQLQQSCSSFGRSARGSSTGVADDQQQLLQQQWAALEQPQQQLLPHEDTLAFAQALRMLQQQPVFSQAALERTVEAIRADVSGWFGARHGSAA